MLADDVLLASSSNVNDTCVTLMLINPAAAGVFRHPPIAEGGGR